MDAGHVVLDIACVPDPFLTPCALQWSVRMYASSTSLNLKNNVVSCEQYLDDAVPSFVSLS
eukprot:scaffold142299_cov86-Attheya_sp.AAC.1